VTDDRDPVAVTGGLLDALLGFAADAEPGSVSIALVATPAGDWAAVADDRPVYTDFYLPDAGRAVNEVFGVELGTPPTAGGGRFVSHPGGDRALDRTDDLAARVFVAVPPWGREDVRPYDRRGRRHPMEVVEGAPPQGDLD